MPELYNGVRYVVFAAFAVSVLAAVAGWLVRTRRVSPFSALGRALRAASDPLIRPVETRVVRAGGNPVHAGWWLVVGVAAAGVVLVTVWQWALETAYEVAASLSLGPHGTIVLLIRLVYKVIVIALFVRVFATWFGFHRYTKWLRPAYFLTDWVVEPIRRVLPPMGAFDWSPLAAWLVLVVLQKMLLAIVGG